MSGFKTIVRENIEVSADTTVTLDFVLPVGAVTETVTVTAEGSARRCQERDHRLADRQGADRKAADEPGCVLRPRVDGPRHVRLVQLRTRLPSPTAYGSATNENVFLINGVNATNPEAGAFGTLVNVNYDAVDEVRVVGLGSKAEYGSFSGATIDVVTKSGSNAFHGSGAVVLAARIARQQPARRRTTISERPGCTLARASSSPARPRSDWETSVTAGGPIRKDKLWFFGAFDYLRQLQPASSLVAAERVVEPLHRWEGFGRAVQESSRLGFVPLREQ